MLLIIVNNEIISVYNKDTEMCMHVLYISFKTLIVYCLYICKERVWEYIKQKYIYDIVYLNM